MTVEQQPNSSMSPRPFVSVVVPCRNERAFIVECLESILANDYPSDRLEVLVVDAMSDDGTRELLGDLAQRHPTVAVLDNPARITPAGLNVGIRAARGTIVMRMDAHARLAPDYIRRSVEALDAFGADNVGGIMHTVPRDRGPFAEAITTVLSHRFGVGNSVFRTHTDTPTWVDTVFGGCYRREVFARVGLFNEDLVRGQDMEFNLRLKKAGGRTLLVPQIVSYYYPPTTYRAFLKHSWTNGVWAILPFAASRIVPVSWRHLVPLAFVLTCLLSAAAALLWPPARVLLVAVVAAYICAVLVATVHAAGRRRRANLLLTLPFTFATLHLAYGLGSLWGVVALLRGTGAPNARPRPSAASF